MSIQERRLKKGWSQEELALHAGLSSRTIQRIESGQVVGSESLKCLAAVFEISIDIIIIEQNNKISKSTEKSVHLRLNETEKEAIAFGQSLIKGPQKGQVYPLSKIERDAINFGKSLLNKLKK